MTDLAKSIKRALIAASAGQAPPESLVDADDLLDNAIEAYLQPCCGEVGEHLLSMMAEEAMAYRTGSKKLDPAAVKAVVAEELTKFCAEEEKEKIQTAARRATHPKTGAGKKFGMP